MPQNVNQNTNQNANSAPRTVADFLFEILTKAPSWIKPEYKEMAQRHRNDTNALLQIFLCNFDNVDASKMKMVENSKDVASKFEKIRELYLKEKYEKNYVEQIKLLQNNLSLVTEELQKIHGKVDSINETMPIIEELFHQQEPSTEQVGALLFEDNNKKSQKAMEVSGESTEDKEANVGVNETIEKSSKADVSKEINRTDIKENDISQTIEVRNHPETQNKEDVSKHTSIEHGSIISRFIHRIANKPSKFLDKLYKEGYDDEKVEFVIKCLEEGYSETEIRRFISPNMSVDLMEKLKKIQKRKDDNHGTR